VRINDDSAMQLTAVWGSVSLISESIATLPLKQYRLVGGQPVEMPLAPVVERPWAEITLRDFIMQGTLSMLLRGNLWGRIVSRDERLLPTQVKLVSPRNAKVRRNQTTGQIEYRFWNEIVPPDDVTRAMALSMPEDIIGMNPIQYLRNSLGIARAQDLYAGGFLANSAKPDGWIGVDDDLDDEETKAMLLSWLAAHQGPNHAGLPAILTGGAKFNAITMSMADAQFLQQMQYSASVISGMIFRVPPHMLGMVDKDTSWGAGIEQQELGYVRNTLLIWLERWQDLFLTWLPPKQFVTFDLSQRLRGDTLQRFSAYQIARVIGSMNNLEIRQEEGQPIPDDPEQVALLSRFDAPLNSAPVKPISSSGAGPGGDSAD
jgi:HK97 family phage portal protein